MSDKHIDGLTHANLAKRTHEMLMDRGDKDYLTGLLNMRGLEAESSRLKRLLVRESDFLDYNILVMDLIGLKALDVKLGHLGADEKLKETANHLQSCASRPTDLVARISGDEFVIVALNSERGKIDGLIEEIKDKSPEGIEFNMAFKNYNQDYPIIDAVNEVVDKIDRVKNLRPHDSTGRVIGDGVVVDLDKTNV